MDSRWSTLPIDIVGKIASYTRQLRRRRDSFANQIDVDSPAFKAIRQCVQKKAESQAKGKRAHLRPFTNIPFSDMLGIIHDDTFYGYGTGVSYCRDGLDTWYKINDPWYICAEGDHPYFRYISKRH